MRKVRLPLAPPVLQAVVDLGTALRDMRRRRHIPMAQAAERARISRSTLHKIERGDPSMSLGIYVAVLQVYGLVERLPALAEARLDRAGLALEAGWLPRRIRGAREGERENPASLR